MANERLVVEALNNLTGQFQNETEASRRHKENISAIQSKGRQIDLGNQVDMARLAVEDAKVRSDAYLDTPVSFIQYIKESKFPDNVKAHALESAPPDIANSFAKRKNWDQVYREMVAQNAKASTDQTNADRKYDLDKRRTAAYENYARGAAGRAGGKSEYTVSQKMDDLSRDTKMALDSLKDEDGIVTDPDMQTKINKAYRKDKRLIRRGQEPHFVDDLVGGEDPPPIPASGNDPLGIRY